MAKLVFIKMEGCPHCVRFQQVWDQLQNLANLEFVQYDMNEDYPNKYKEYTANGYPTILLDNNDNIMMYNDGRTVEQILEFIKKNVNMGLKNGKQMMSEVSKNRAASSNDGSSGIAYGGKNDDDYKIKYLKYKAKYLKLKSMQF